MGGLILIKIGRHASGGGDGQECGVMGTEVTRWYGGGIGGHVELMDNIIMSERASIVSGPGELYFFGTPISSRLFGSSILLRRRIVVYSSSPYMIYIFFCNKQINNKIRLYSPIGYFSPCPLVRRTRLLRPQGLRYCPRWLSALFTCNVILNFTWTRPGITRTYIRYMYRGRTGQTVCLTRVFKNILRLFFSLCIILYTTDTSINVLHNICANVKTRVRLNIYCVWTFSDQNRSKRHSSDNDTETSDLDVKEESAFNFGNDRSSIGINAASSGLTSNFRVSSYNTIF